MSEDELDVAYREGRLTKRAYVRQLLDRGQDMTAALGRAESLVPSEPAPAPEPSNRAAPGSGHADGPSKMVEGLDINFFEDGYLIYQPARGRVHSLNTTATVVLELCTGDNDATDIARLLQKGFGLGEPPIVETRDCLRTLRDEGLVR